VSSKDSFIDLIEFSLTKITPFSFSAFEFQGCMYDLCHPLKRVENPFIVGVVFFRFPIGSI
jgi:hypothetical protein